MCQVLVVEDDPVIRGILRLVLEEAGNVVSEEADGDRALSRLATSPVPLVVLLDLHLAFRGGNPILGALGADPTLARRHRIVAMSGLRLDQAGETLAPIHSSLAGFLEKPFDLDEVARIVAEAARSLARGSGNAGADHSMVAGQSA